jgi:hypothetical protein
MKNNSRQTQRKLDLLKYLVEKNSGKKVVFFGLKNLDLGF